MASFRKHISWGFVLAVVSTLIGLISSILLMDEIIFWVFLAILMGSFLPDLDYDGGIPFQIIFGLAGLFLTGLVFYFLFENQERDWKILVGFSAAVFVLIRFVLGYIFQKLTRHRGIFHSIPAGVLSGLITIWILEHFSIDFNQALIVGFAVFVGYLGHLILDEIYSTINLKGLSVLPKKSLGSALKLWSPSGKTTFMVYLLLFIFSCLVFV
jgi:uncharacterized membrane protein YeaQ/YmgE (transglycosylase-associated protein family)